MYCVLNMGWTPSQFLNLPYKEKIFVTECILLKLEEEKKQQQKARQVRARKPSMRRR